MDNKIKQEINSKYYIALSNLASLSKEDRAIAIQLQYLLDEFSKPCTTEQEQQQYNEKYDAILNVLNEYTQVERKLYRLSGKLTWRFKQFAIPAEICQKINKIYRKVQAENIGIINASEYRLAQQERRKQINDNLDKLL